MFERIFKKIITIPTIQVQNNPTADLVLGTSKQTRKGVSMRENYWKK